MVAVVLGVFLPIAETVRRWSTWQQAPMSLFDDYILAALLLYGAWLARRDFRRGQLFLAAAWGLVCGVGYGGVLSQIHRLQMGESDPAPISTFSVAVIKGVLFALVITALVTTLRARQTIGEKRQSDVGELKHPTA